MDPGDELARAKADLRARLGKRAPISAAQRRERSEALADHVFASTWWPAADSVAAFVGVRHEPDTTPLLAQALHEGKRLLLPRVDGDDLCWSAIEDLDRLRPGAFGLREPPAELASASLARVALVLLPGLAFGPSGARIGWGRGYYDRALCGALGAGALRVGLCMADRFGPPEARVPAGPADISVHRVVTEAGDVSCVGDIAHPARQ